MKLKDDTVVFPLGPLLGRPCVPQSPSSRLRFSVPHLNHWRNVPSRGGISLNFVTRKLREVVFNES